MREDDPLVFKRFQLWLYTGSLVESLPTGKDVINWQTLAGIYIFAECRGIPTLQNAAIDGYINHCTELHTLPAYTFQRIYSNTVETSPIRRLIVDQMVGGEVNFGDNRWLVDGFEYFPRELLLDIILAQHKRLTATGLMTRTFFHHCPQNYYVSTADSEAGKESQVQSVSQDSNNL